MTLQFSDNFLNYRKIWFHVNGVNNYFIILSIFSTVSSDVKSIIFHHFFWNQNRLGFKKILYIKHLDKQRDTKESRHLNQTKSSYARKGIQIYLKTKKTGQKTRTSEVKIKLKTKSERKLKWVFFNQQKYT